MGAYTRRDADGVAQDLEAVFDYFPVLRERAEQRAGSLSGGEQQMLAISRALMARPGLMLLDEPSLGLSPKLVKDIFDIIVRINRERGVTILLVEQNANMALQIARLRLRAGGRPHRDGRHLRAAAARRKTSRSSTWASRKQASAARGAGRRRRPGDEDRERRSRWL